MKLSKKTGFYGLFGINLFLSLFFCVHIVSSAGEAGNAVENACRGVVRILTEESRGIGMGSGFGVGRVGKETDIFVTNWHVVTPDDGSKPDGIYILLSNDAVKKRQDGWYNFDRSQMVECEVLYTTTGYPDLAILKAERPIEDHIALPLMRAQKASRGDSIYAIGFPATSDISNGKSYLYAGIDDVNISTGVVSKFFEYGLGGSTWAIQHDAQINHGNSGGPLVTKDGDVIGINTYGFGDNPDEAPGEYSVSIFVDYAMQALNELEIPYNVYDSDMRYILYLLAAVLAVSVVFVLVKKKAKLSGAKASPDPAASSPSPVPSPNPAVLSPNPVPSPAPGPSPSPVKSRWQIQGVSGVFAKRKIMIDKKIRIGRAAADNDLVYPADASGISRHHCEIMEENGIIYIRDTGSSYGTYLEGKKIPGNQWTKMQEGSGFYLADARESFKVVKTAGT